MLEVGQKVTVRYDLRDDERYENVRANDEMVALAGKETKITSKTFDRTVEKIVYSIEADNETWLWTEQMFQTIQKVDYTKHILGGGKDV